MHFLIKLYVFASKIYIPVLIMNTICLGLLLKKTQVSHFFYNCIHFSLINPLKPFFYQDPVPFPWGCIQFSLIATGYYPFHCLLSSANLTPQVSNFYSSSLLHFLVPLAVNTFRHFLQYTIIRFPATCPFAASTKTSAWNFPGLRFLMPHYNILTAFRVRLLV